jgi:hypothetical protein
MKSVLVFNLKLEGQRNSDYSVLRIYCFMRFPVYAALTAEARVRTVGSPCGIYVALGKPAPPPPPSTSVFRRHYLSINSALYSYFIHLPSTLHVETDSVVKWISEIHAAIFRTQPVLLRHEVCIRVQNHKGGNLLICCWIRTSATNIATRPSVHHTSSAPLAHHCTTRPAACHLSASGPSGSYSGGFGFECRPYYR